LVETSPHPPIQLAAPGGEISRKDLSTLIRRFLHLHRQRLQALCDQLPARQRDCLEALPLLFHCHHPALPGYHQGQAPAGIDGYSASGPARKALLRLVPGLDYRPKRVQSSPIQGLFLMGSVESQAYPNRSDWEVWVCHSPELKPDELAALRAKGEEISTWLSELGLKAHFSLIDAQGFRQGQLEPLSGATAFPGLLLEEFYRTAVHLAGKALLWWLVPAEQEAHYREYADYLLSKRFVEPETVIDLGGLANLPARELASAALWHLHKALTSPYEELPKLYLLLDYASAYPHPTWLATSIKAAIYAGQVDAARLDPYLLLYQRSERIALAQGQSKLLPLLRRCFAHKIRTAFNRPELRAKLKAQLQSFGLDPAAFSLGEVDLKRIEQAQEEQQLLIQTLEQSYLKLSQFVSQHQALANEDLELLGRRLSAALERRPDKVEILRLVPEGGFVESKLRLHLKQAPDGSWYWQLELRGEIPAPPLYQARYLTQALAWAQANKIELNSQWTLDPRPLPLTLAELRFLAQGVGRLLEKRAEPELAVYRQPACIRAAAWFLNIATPAHPQRGGFEVASDRFDPLSYGADRRVLLQHLEALTLDSWGEIRVSRYEGLEGLLDALCCLYEQDDAAAALEVYCFSSKTLALRLFELYRELVHALQANSASWFVLRGGTQFYVFSFRAGRLGWWRCEDELALGEALGQARLEFTPVVFDAWAAQGSLLAFLYHHNRPNVVQVFLRPHPGGVEVLVLDERGALYRRDYPGAPPKIVLQRYAALLKALALRYPSSAKAEYAWVEPTASGWRLAGARTDQPVEPAIRVRVYAEEVPGGPPRFTLVCNEREFSALDLGDQVFAEASRYILSLRRSGEGYPCYVSDLQVPPKLLGLSAPALVHTARLLAYKSKIEHRLNP
jgi:adenylate cyclase class 1